jgi:hypothetical protein
MIATQTSTAGLPGPEHAGRLVRAGIDAISVNTRKED